MKPQAKTLTLLFLTVATSSVVSLAAPPAAPPPLRVVGYYPSWVAESSGYQVSQIPATMLTHVNYAFAKIASDGRCVLGDPQRDAEAWLPGNQASDPFRGNLWQLHLLQKRHPHLKTLISIGGWDWSDNFSDAALTDATRQRFAASCVDFMLRYRFDGIDVDWEYPVFGGSVGMVARAEDRENFTALLAVLRTHLEHQGDRDGRHYLLTIAAPAAPEVRQHLEIDKFHSDLDFINLMTYDLAGDWSEYTGFHASLASTQHESSHTAARNCQSTVRHYLDQGVPPEKLVLGIPFYGRGWKGVPPTGAGLFQEHEGKSHGDDGGGMYPYRFLADRYFGKVGTCFWDSKAQAGWLYDRSRRLMISYEDRRAVGLKTDYVRQQGLGGLMLWELSQDTQDDRSLLKRIHQRLHTTGP